MHKTFKCFVEKGLQFTLFLGLILILLFSTCNSKSISNPYKDQIKKPKPCKCGGNSRFGLTAINLDYSTHQQILLPKNGFNSHRRDS